MYTALAFFGVGILPFSAILLPAASRHPPIQLNTTKPDTWNYPQIGPGIDKNDPNRGSKLFPRPGLETSGAFNNAFELLHYAINIQDTDQDWAIFQKYFNAADKMLVTALFTQILNNTKNDDHGAEEMIYVIVVGGDKDDPQNPAPAAITSIDTPQPTITITEDAWAYPDRDTYANACSMWDKEGITHDMYILGSVLLHEYMFWDWFLHRILHGQIRDQNSGYGWKDARALEKRMAIYNADSYCWYATELFWAIICRKKTGYDPVNDRNFSKGPSI
ncbi:hypothetical protein F4777DRAFT_574541 [Nemania sp. FL0916]|nr:hypothetical protein F4777DRAFT_574541 [Nemania sp. FL0916]